MIVVTFPMMMQIMEWGVTLLGVAYSGFKAYAWVKDMREKDLAQIKTGVDELKGTMLDVKAEITSQTKAIVTELQEQREYMKILYGPVINRLMQAPAPVRAKRTPRKKKA